MTLHDKKQEIIDAYHCHDHNGEECDCNCENCKKILAEDLAELMQLVRQQEQDFVEHKCKKLGIDYTQIYTCNSAD